MKEIDIPDDIPVGHAGLVKHISNELFSTTVKIVDLLDGGTQLNNVANIITTTYETVG